MDIPPCFRKGSTQITTIGRTCNKIIIEINYSKKIHKYMKIEQHATEQPIGQRINQKRS